MKESKYIEKALELFKAEGVSMTIETIADKIGVTKKTLYNNFESKDGLISKCLEQVVIDLQDNLKCMDDESKSVEECFRDGIYTLMDFFKESCPLFIKEVLKFYPKFAANKHNAGFEFFNGKLQQLIVRGQNEGIFRKDIDTRLIAGYISFSTFSYFKKSYMIEGGISADHYFDQIIEFNYNALIIK